MGQDPDAIRREIEETRERMGETVGAIGYKADVPTRAKEAVSGRVQSAAGIAQENPLGLAVGSIAIGFLAGMLIPTTNVENEKLGPVADEVKDQVKETGQEALERGKQVAQEVAETAQESAQHAAQELKESATT